MTTRSQQTPSASALNPARRPFSARLHNLSSLLLCPFSSCFIFPPTPFFFSRLLVLDYVQVSFRITSPLCFALLGASFALLPVCLRISCRLCFALYLCFLLHYLTALFQCIIYRFCLVSFAGSPSRGGDVKVYVCDMNQPSLPTPFYSVLVSI